MHIIYSLDVVTKTLYTTAFHFRAIHAIDAIAWVRIANRIDDFVHSETLLLLLLNFSDWAIWTVIIKVAACPFLALVCVLKTIVAIAVLIIIIIITLTLIVIAIVIVIRAVMQFSIGLLPALLYLYTPLLLVLIVVTVRTAITAIFIWFVYLHFCCWFNLWVLVSADYFLIVGLAGKSDGWLW